MIQNEGKILIEKQKYLKPVVDKLVNRGLPAEHIVTAEAPVYIGWDMGTGLVEWDDSECEDVPVSAHHYYKLDKSPTHTLADFGLDADGNELPAIITNQNAAKGQPSSITQPPMTKEKIKVTQVYEIEYSSLEAREEIISMMQTDTDFKSIIGVTNKGSYHAEKINEITIKSLWT